MNKKMILLETLNRLKTPVLRYAEEPVRTANHPALRSTSEPASVGCICLFAMLIAFLSPVVRADPPAPTTAQTANDDANRNIVLPTEPGDHKLKFRTHIGSRLVQMSYLLHLPPDYGDTNKKHPMLVFLHGIGECGTDLSGVYALGPMTLIKQDGGNPTFAASCPFIVLCPQCPPRGETWDDDFMYKAVAQLVDQTVKKTRCEPDRVSITGLSMGGIGSWCVAEQAPELFAAVAPLSSMKWQDDKAGELLKFTAAWSIVGVEDESRFFEGTRTMQKAMAGGLAARRFTYLHDNGHDAWFPAYDNPQFYEWLLAQRRPAPADRSKLTPPPTTQPIPTVPGHYLMSFDVKIGRQPYNLDYVLYLPRGYRPDAAPSPAMLFLHEQDTIGPDFHDICMHGPDLALERNPALKDGFPLVVISPRLPIKLDWQSPGMTQALLALLDHVNETIKLDSAHLCVSGINAGAGGAWKLAAEAHGRFSTIVPVITDGISPQGVDRAAVVSHLRGRAFSRANDIDALDQMKNLLSGAKQDWKLMKLPANADALGDLPVFGDRELLNWLKS